MINYISEWICEKLAIDYLMITAISLLNVKKIAKKLRTYTASLKFEPIYPSNSSPMLCHCANAITDRRRSVCLL